MTHRGNSDKSVASRSTGRSSSRIGLAGCESPPAAGVPDILSGCVPAALGSTPDGVGRRHVLVRIAGGDLVPPDALAAPTADSVQAVVAVALRVPALVCSAPAGAPEKHAPVAASAVAG